MICPHWMKHALNDVTYLLTFLQSEKPTSYFLTAVQLPIYSAIKLFSVFTSLMLVKHAHYNTNIHSLHNGLQLCKDT